MYWKSGAKLAPKSVFPCLSCFFTYFLWYIASFFWYSCRLTLMQWTSISLWGAPLLDWFYIFKPRVFWLFWFDALAALFIGAKLIRLKKLVSGTEEPDGVPVSLRRLSRSLQVLTGERRLPTLEKRLVSLADYVAGAGELDCAFGWSLWPWMNWHLWP